MEFKFTPSPTFEARRAASAAEDRALISLRERGFDASVGSIETALILAEKLRHFTSDSEMQRTLDVLEERAKGGYADKIQRHQTICGYFNDIAFPGLVRRHLATEVLNVGRREADDLVREASSVYDSLNFGTIERQILLLQKQYSIADLASERRIYKSLMTKLAATKSDAINCHLLRAAINLLGGVKADGSFVNIDPLTHKPYFPFWGRAPFNPALAQSEITAAEVLHLKLFGDLSNFYDDTFRELSSTVKANLPTCSPTFYFAEANI